MPHSSLPSPFIPEWALAAADEDNSENSWIFNCAESANFTTTDPVSQQQIHLKINQKPDSCPPAATGATPNSQPTGKIYLKINNKTRRITTSPVPTLPPRTATLPSIQPGSSPSSTTASVSPDSESEQKIYIKIDFKTNRITTSRTQTLPWRDTGLEGELGRMELNSNSEESDADSEGDSGYDSEEDSEDNSEDEPEEEPENDSDTEQSDDDWDEDNTWVT